MSDTKQFVNHWLIDTYGLDADAAYTAGEVEELAEMLARDVVLAERARCAEIAKNILTIAAEVDPSITQDPKKLGEAIATTIEAQPH